MTHRRASAGDRPAGPRDRGASDTGDAAHSESRLGTDSIARLVASPPDLPVRAGFASVREALASRGVVVVQAPPGTGKTTLIPPLVASVVSGKVIVTQPRRIAARAAARRLAGLMGEDVGMSVGYSVRGDSKVSAATRIEVVTTGVLVRRLQRDPELTGVSAVILDECHERHLDADLALALLVDVRENLRPDLVLVAMSATLEAERTAALLGEAEQSGDVALTGDAAPSSDAASPADSAPPSGAETPRGGPAPVVAIPSVLFEIETHWTPSPGPRTDARGVTYPFLDHVAATVRQALAAHDGDVLVFVPGVGEASGVISRLGRIDADVLPLHGRLPAREQDRALTLGARRRVIVSTAVAESSLTVPGVRIVVDAGFSREPRTDHRRGLAGLVTVSVSQSSAEQRAGRAGREGPGVVYRLWNEHDHPRLAPHPTPEILTADLTSFALDLALWGTPDGEGLALLDAPPATALASAHATLVGLGALDESYRITPRGRQIAAIATDPRLARALLDAEAVVGPERAAEVVALMSDDVRAPGGDLGAALRTLRRGGPGSGAWTEQVRRLRQSAGRAADRRPHKGGQDGKPTEARESSGRPSAALDARSSGATNRSALSDDLATGFVVGLAHPERIARRRPGASRYLMVSGTGAALPPGSPLAGYEWLAIADADRGAGRADAMIRSAAPIDEDHALEAAIAWLNEDDSVEWAGGRVVAERTTHLGAIELMRAKIADPNPERVLAAVVAGLAAEGVSMLRWTDAARALRERLDFLHRTLGAPWPDVSDDALSADPAAWLGPELGRIRGARDVARIDVLAALRRLLPWPEAARLDELAPERITVPSGSNVRVDYGPAQPVLAVRLQETFGWAQAPRLAGGKAPVLLHLLSPAGRPAAVTADLASFWEQGYPQVRAELRGRYPKHAWPIDPSTEPPARPRARRP